MVDEPGEQVGGRVQHPDAARHRAHLLVRPYVRKYPISPMRNLNFYETVLDLEDSEGK